MSPSTQSASGRSPGSLGHASDSPSRSSQALRPGPFANRPSDDLLDLLRRSARSKAAASREPRVVIGCLKRQNSVTFSGHGIGPRPSTLIPVVVSRVPCALCHTKNGDRTSPERHVETSRDPKKQTSHRPSPKKLHDFQTWAVAVLAARFAYHREGHYVRERPWCRTFWNGRPWC